MVNKWCDNGYMMFLILPLGTCDLLVYVAEKIKKTILKAFILVSYLCLWNFEKNVFEDLIFMHIGIANADICQNMPKVITFSNIICLNYHSF